MTILRELPNGKINVYRVDLSSLQEERFDAIHEFLNNHSYICDQVPGKQILKVYWNCEGTPSSIIDLPPGSVSPWVDR